ncbi:hypothetical protein [Streptomyces chrestomyceticus]|uniref:hypothetical protein n=1 Tax=Streptomyces chrestomyceticus TaxID=68185 RepID=UPI00379FA28F
MACTVSAHRTAIKKRGGAVLKRARRGRIEALRAHAHDSPLRAHAHDSRALIAHPLTTLRLLIEDPTVRAATNRRPPRAAGLLMRPAAPSPERGGGAVGGLR